MKKVNKQVTKKMVAQHNRKVRKDNAAFEKLNRAEKRVAIAYDVLAQLKSGRLKATVGIWLSDASDAFALIDGQTAQDQKDIELQEILRKKKKCNGCAVGGLFMCAVERANKLKVKELCDFNDLSEEEYQWKGRDVSAIEIEDIDAFPYLRRFFSLDQLQKIETAFEQGKGAHLSDEESKSFVDDVKDPSERMRLIMENIIIHKGTFRPHKTPIYVRITPGFVG